MSYYEKASAKGHVDAKIKLAELYIGGVYVEKNYEKAFTLLKSALKNENGKVYLMIGLLYFKGKGVEKNLEEGAIYFEKSANLGVSEGAFRIGTCYFEGTGVRRSEEMATKYLVQAAEAGFEKAYFYVGGLYYKGKYLKNDLRMAVYYFEKSIECGFEEASRYLAKVKFELMELEKEEEAQRQRQMEEKFFELSEERIREQKKKDRENEGEDEVLKLDGLISMLEGENTHNKATEKIFKDTEHEKQEIKTRLEAEQKSCSERHVRERVLARAALNEFESLRQFAESGNDEAQYLMGMSYLEGKYSGKIQIIESNIDYAMDWFAKSSAQGHTLAKEKLTYCAQEKAKVVAAEAAKIQEKLKKDIVEKNEKKIMESQIAAKAARNEFDSLVQYAETGSADGLYYLGKAYFEGIKSGNIEVVPVNIEEAIKCLTKSLAGGNIEAFGLLAECNEKKAKEEQKRKDKINAHAMKNEFKALVQYAETGSPDALYYLGMSYYEGMNSGEHEVVGKDIKKAMECFVKAKEGGNAEAISMLEKCEEFFRKEDEAKKARIKARAAKNEFDSLVQFAETGNSDAQYYLATQYMED